MKRKVLKIICATVVLSCSHNVTINASENSNACNDEVINCKLNTISWQKIGETEKIISGNREPNSLYKEKTMQKQISEMGMERSIVIKEDVEKYDENGRLIQKQIKYYDENEKQVAEDIIDYKFNTIKKDSIVYRTRKYTSGKLILDTYTPVTWTNAGVVLNKSGIKNQKNGKYIEDYQEKLVSNFGDSKSKRIDYRTSTYDEFGRLKTYEDLGYDENGNCNEKILKDYKYNELTKKDVKSRTRIYRNEKKVLDEVVPVTWKKQGIIKSVSRTNSSDYSKYIEDYKEKQVSNFGAVKLKRVDYKISTYDKKGRLKTHEDLGYDVSGKCNEKVLKDYVYNSTTKKSVLSRTRHYKNEKRISDVKIKTTWKNLGAKQIKKTGKKNYKNSTYIEDFKQTQISNFGGKRTLRVDYKLWKYNKSGQATTYENRDYDKNGIYSGKTIRNYYYDNISKKSINTRIRTYKNGKKTSDLKKNQLKKPTRKGTITNEFNGFDMTYSKGHKGIDIAASKGTSIYPVITGKIIEISYDRIGGNKVVLHHKINGINYVTYYGHMSKLTKNYKVGDIVGINDKIGTMGSTGLATGSHLHFELMVGTSKKDRTKAVNPRTYIEFPRLWKSY